MHLSRACLSLLRCISCPAWQLVSCADMNVRSVLHPGRLSWLAAPKGVSILSNASRLCCSGQQKLRRFLWSRQQERLATMSASVLACVITACCLAAACVKTLFNRQRMWRTHLASILTSTYAVTHSLACKHNPIYNPAPLALSTFNTAALDSCA